MKRFIYLYIMFLFLASCIKHDYSNAVSGNEKEEFMAYWEDFKKDDNFQKEHLPDYITYKKIYKCKNDTDTTIYKSKQLLYNLPQFNEHNSRTQFMYINDSHAICTITILFNDVKLNFHFKKDKTWRLNNITEEIQCTNK